MKRGMMGKLGIVMVMMIMLTALVPSSYSESKVLIIAMGTDITTLDPHNIPDNPSEMVCRNIYEGLVEFDEKLNIKPALAESWEISEGGKVYIFHLRKGVKFHDGAVFNAEAVKANIDRLFKNKTLAGRSRLVPFIEKVEVVDEYTVKFVLKHPVPTFLNLLAHPVGLMVSPKALKEGVNLKRNPVGTGPYKLGKWVPGDRVELVANEEWWGGKPGLDGIVFKVVPEDEARVQMVVAGDAHVALRVPPIDIERLKMEPDVVVEPVNTIRILYLGVNTRHPILKDKRVRQAISLAIDREIIVEKILRGAGRAAKSVIAEEVLGFYDTGKIGYNPERAKELLKEAGYPEGFEIVMWTPKGRYLGDYEIAQAVQQYLVEIGIKAELRTMEWASYVSFLFTPPEKADPKERGLFIIGWAPSTGEFIGVFRPLFLSTNIPKFNIWYYNNSEVDELITKAEKAAPEEIVKYTSKIQEILLDELPAIPLVNVGDVIAYRKNVEGLIYLGTEILLTKYASLKG